MAGASRTQFQVDFFQSDDAQEHFIRLQVLAKMPLGALAFGLGRARLQECALVVVRTPEGDEYAYYHVHIEGTKLHYDIAKIVEDDQQVDPPKKPRRRGA